MTTNDNLMTTNNVTATGVQDDQPRKNVFVDLRAPGVLAKWPMIGAVMFIFGTLMFAYLTYDLFAHGPLLALDRALANTWPAIALKSPPFVIGIMDAGFYLGFQVVAVLALLVGIYLLYRRYWQELAMLTIGLAGQSVLFFSLTTVIARPRPPTQVGIIVHVPGFPSGHAMLVVVFYGLLAYLLIPNLPSAFWKVVVAAAALFIIGFVGFSRVFAGGHYLTDVLAGYAVGIAWFGLAYTVIEIYYQRRSQNVNQA